MTEGLRKYGGGSEGCWKGEVERKGYQEEERKRVAKSGI
jgi:hypothetical protein